MLPKNKAALSFWRKTIPEYTQGDFSESLKTKQVYLMLFKICSLDFAIARRRF